MELLHYIVRLQYPEHFQFIYDVGQKNPALWQALGYRLFVELGTEDAQEEKQNYLKRLEWERERKKLQEERKGNALDPPPLERAVSYLKAFTNGETDAWWQMSRWMIVNTDGRSTNLLIVETDMTQLPVWEQMDNETQSKVIELAPRFIMDCDPQTYPWRENTRTIYHPIVAGCRAFRLLLDRDQNSLLSLPQEAWRKWASALTYYLYDSRSFSIVDDASKRNKALWRLFYLLATDEFIETMLWIIDKENKNDRLYVTDHIDEMWDEHLARLLFKKTQDNQLTIKSVAKILERISAHDFDLVDTYLKPYFCANRAHFYSV